MRENSRLFTEMDSQHAIVDLIEQEPLQIFYF